MCDRRQYGTAARRGRRRVQAASRSRAAEGVLVWLCYWLVLLVCLYGIDHVQSQTIRIRSREQRED